MQIKCSTLLSAGKMAAVIIIKVLFLCVPRCTTFLSQYTEYIKLLDWRLALRKCSGSRAMIIIKVLFVKVLDEVAEHARYLPQTCSAFWALGKTAFPTLPCSELWSCD